MCPRLCHLDTLKTVFSSERASTVKSRHCKNYSSEAGGRYSWQQWAKILEAVSTAQHQNCKLLLSVTRAWAPVEQAVAVTG